MRFFVVKTVDGVVTHHIGFDTEAEALENWKQKINGFTFVLHSINYAYNEETKVGYQVWVI